MINYPCPHGVTRYCGVCEFREKRKIINNMENFNNLSHDQLLYKVAKIKGFDYSLLHDTFSRVENGIRVWYDIPSYKKCIEILKENEN